MKNVFFTKEFANKNLKNHIVFICDHSTNYIPKKYNYLGLSRLKLKSHIAYDIGAKNITINLAKKLRQSYFLSNFSRLLIDPNRSIYDKDLIITNSFGIEIPGNLNISKSEKKKRISKIYDVYHHNLLKFVRDKKKKFQNVFVISIHSYTKESLDFNRAIKIGLLWNKNMNLLLPIQRKLMEKKIHFGRNYPYSGFHFNHTLDTINKRLKVNNICIEIRNDLICNQKGITKYMDLFSNILKDILDDH